MAVGCFVDRLPRLLKQRTIERFEDDLRRQLVDLREAPPCLVGQPIEQRPVLLGEQGDILGFSPTLQQRHHRAGTAPQALIGDIHAIESPTQAALGIQRVDPVVGQRRAQPLDE